LGESVAMDATAPRTPGLGLTEVRTTLRANRASTEVSGLDYRGREVAGYLNDAALRETADAAALLSFLPVPNGSWQGGNGEQGEGVHSERLWATAVSGPFLALNPHVADDIIAAVFSSRGIPVPKLTEAHGRVDTAAETARAWIRSRLGGA
jgi:CobQ-like glutamine amidotransferase family enzyme